MGGSATWRIRADCGRVRTADKSLTTSRAWVGAGLWGQGQEFARPTDIRSHRSKVQTPSRQAGLKGPAKRVPRIRRLRPNHRVRWPKLGSNQDLESRPPHGLLNVGANQGRA